MDNVVGRGAEAVLVRQENVVVKTRLPKAYRHPELDLRLRRFRTRREAKVMERLCKAGMPVPALVACDDKGMAVTMSFVDGRQMQDVLSSNPVRFAGETGRLVARIHAQDIIHGDLTTSNLLLAGNVVHLIDFGLSFFSDKPEDKATDLHVLLQGLRALHGEDVASVVLDGYRTAGGREDVLLRLEQVESRGRNKKK